MKIRPTIGRVCALLPLAVACGQDVTGAAWGDAGAGDTSQASDVAQVADVAPLDDTGAPPDGEAPDAHAIPEVPDVPPSPDAGARCAEGEACAGLPDDDGVCWGGCFAQPQTLSCAGTVFEHLCLPPGAPIPGTPDPSVITLGALRVTVLEQPPRAHVGETHALSLQVQNLSSSAVSLPFGTSWKPNWNLADGNFLEWSSLDLPAGGSTAITAEFEALRPDVFDLDGGWLVTFYLGDQVLELHAGVAMAAADVPAELALPCGDVVYPSAWCGDELCTKALRFDTARCCDAVFFPGATCCDDADCSEGACVDGACVGSVPRLEAANSLLHGTQRLLIVLADYPAFASWDPCQDQAEALRDTLGLDVVESWLRGHALTRTGQDLVDFRWTVLAGLDTDAIVPPGGDRWIPAYREALAVWLAARPECPALADFDKVIVAAAKADLHGLGGVYVGDGTVGVGSYTSPYLFAHELTHSFGATDLGQTLEGPYLYPQALMATHSAADATDQVAWGEIGWGDVDRNRVIDVFEVAAYPETLEVADLRVRVVGAAPNEHLEVTWRFEAVEDGVAKRAYLPRFRFELPHVGLWMDAADAHDTKRVDVPRDGLDWEALLAAGTLTVHVSASLAFTDPDGKRQVLTVDTSEAVPLE